MQPAPLSEFRALRVRFRIPPPTFPESLRSRTRLLAETVPAYAERTDSFVRAERTSFGENQEIRAFSPLSRARVYVFYARVTSDPISPADNFAAFSPRLRIRLRNRISCASDFIFRPPPRRRGNIRNNNTLCRRLHYLHTL